MSDPSPTRNPIKPSKSPKKQNKTPNLKITSYLKSSTSSPNKSPINLPMQKSYIQQKIDLKKTKKIE